jgi:hypothetical protein
MSTSVTVDVVPDAEVSAYNVKISTDAFEVNVIVAVAEADGLKRVRNTSWESGALRIGTSAGVPAWWCAGDGGHQNTLSILIGEDDETWQIALQLPIEAIDDILREIADADSATSSP